MTEVGKCIWGWTVDIGVGGGASKTVVLRMEGDSPATAGEDNLEVWRESFGLLGATGLDDGITDSIAPATCLRSSDMWGWESCRGGREDS